MLHSCVTLVRRPRYPGRGWFSKDVGRACQKQPGVLARVLARIHAPKLNRRGVRATVHDRVCRLFHRPGRMQDVTCLTISSLLRPPPPYSAYSSSSLSLLSALFPFVESHSLPLSIPLSSPFIFTILLISLPLPFLSLSLSFLRCPASLRILADSSSRLLATGLPSYAALRPAPICANLRSPLRPLSLSLSLSLHRACLFSASYSPLAPLPSLPSRFSGTRVRNGTFESAGFCDDAFSRGFHELWEHVLGKLLGKCAVGRVARVLGGEDDKGWLRNGEEYFDDHYGRC